VNCETGLPCLHCQIMEIVQEHAGVDSDNEIIFKVLEVLAEIIAAAPTRAMRRSFVAEVGKVLPGLVTAKLSQRNEAGIPPSTLVSRH
jgi:hypothetical protein